MWQRTRDFRGRAQLLRQRGAACRRRQWQRSAADSHGFTSGGSGLSARSTMRCHRNRLADIAAVQESRPALLPLPAMRRSCARHGQPALLHPRQALDCGIAIPKHERRCGPGIFCGRLSEDIITGLSRGALVLRDCAQFLVLHTRAKLVDVRKVASAARCTLRP